MEITTPLFDINDVYTTKQLILTLYNMNPSLPNNILSKCLEETNKLGGLVRYNYLDTRERTAFEFSFDHKIENDMFLILADIVVTETVKSIMNNNIPTFKDLYNKISKSSYPELHDLVYRAINCIQTYTDKGSYFIYMLA